MSTDHNIDPTYLRYIHDGLNIGGIHAENASSLPEGIIGIYEEALPLNTNVTDRKRFLDFFCVWALMKKEVSTRFVAEILEWGELEVIEHLGKYSKWFNSPVSNKYSLYHQNLKLFILSRTQNNIIYELNEKIINLISKNLNQSVKELLEYKYKYLLEHSFFANTKNEKDTRFQKLLLDEKFTNDQFSFLDNYEFIYSTYRHAIQYFSFLKNDEITSELVSRIDSLLKSELKSVLAKIEKSDSGNLAFNVLSFRQYLKKTDNGKEKYLKYVFYCLIKSLYWGNDTQTEVYINLLKTTLDEDEIMLDDIVSVLHLIDVVESNKRFTSKLLFLFNFYDDFGFHRKLNQYHLEFYVVEDRFLNKFKINHFKLLLSLKYKFQSALHFYLNVLNIFDVCKDNQKLMFIDLLTIKELQDLVNELFVAKIWSDILFEIVKLKGNRLLTEYFEESFSNYLFNTKGSFFDKCLASDYLFRTDLFFKCSYEFKMKIVDFLKKSFHRIRGDNNKKLILATEKGFITYFINKDIELVKKENNRLNTIIDKIYEDKGLNLNIRLELIDAFFHNEYDYDNEVFFDKIDSGSLLNEITKRFLYLDNDTQFKSLKKIYNIHSDESILKLFNSLDNNSEENYLVLKYTILDEINLDESAIEILRKIKNPVTREICVLIALFKLKNISVKIFNQLYDLLSIKLTWDLYVIGEIISTNNQDLFKCFFENFISHEVLLKKEYLKEKKSKFQGKLFCNEFDDEFIDLLAENYKENEFILKTVPIVLNEKVFDDYYDKVDKINDEYEKYIRIQRVFNFEHYFRGDGCLRKWFVRTSKFLHDYWKYSTCGDIIEKYLNSGKFKFGYKLYKKILDFEPKSNYPRITTWQNLILNRILSSDFNAALTLFNNQDSFPDKNFSSADSLRAEIFFKIKNRNEFNLIKNFLDTNIYKLKFDNNNLREELNDVFHQTTNKSVIIEKIINYKYQFFKIKEICNLLFTIENKYDLLKDIKLKYFNQEHRFLINYLFDSLEYEDIEIRKLSEYLFIVPNWDYLQIVGQLYDMKQRVIILKNKIEMD